MSDVFYGNLLWINVNLFFIDFLLNHLVIAEAFSLEDILTYWNWLANNIFKVLLEMESFEEMTNFTICKIQSLVAQQKLQTNNTAGVNVASLNESQSKFKDLFGLPDEDSLVIQYTCKYVLYFEIIK